MSGVTPLVDTLLATTLAQRPDLVPLKGQVEIDGPRVVTDAEKIANDTRLPSRAAIDRQLGAELLNQDETAGGRQSSQSGTTTLSATARAISAILGSSPGTAGAIRGSAPVWSLPLAPAPHLMAAALARTVATSGLFYESHLLSYAGGTRTLAQMAQEPQARLGPLAQTHPDLLNAPATQNSGLLAALVDAIPHATPAPGVQTKPAAPSPVIIEPGAQPLVANSEAEVSTWTSSVEADAAAFVNNAEAETPASTSNTEAHATARPADNGPPGNADSAPGAASESGSSAAGLSGRLNPASVAAAYSSTGSYGVGNVAGYQIGGESDVYSAKNLPMASSEAARNSGHAVAVIHPDAIGLVRQQLEFLAVPVFRWSGEAWPGTQIDWEISEREDARDDRQGTADAAPAQRTWNTRLSMTLPALGAIEVRLSLADKSLQARLAVREDMSLVALDKNRDDLRQRFDVAGLQLTEFQVVSLALHAPEEDMGTK